MSLQLKCPAPLALLLMVMGFVHLPAAHAAEGQLTCRDEDGSQVDWFAAIKIPRQGHDYDDDSKYFIFTSKEKQWRLSKFTVVDTDGALFKTINPAYQSQGSNTTVAIMYNDERPPHSGLSWSHGTGHMKGALAFESGASGFWLIDSVPKFPGWTSYLYPDTGLRFGQHFFCITFGFSQLTSIARQLEIAHPIVFFHNLPDWIGEKIPDLRNLVANKAAKMSTTTSLAKLVSSGGQPFIHFSKSGDFGKDLYDSFVAPMLQTSLYMEGWVDGRGDLPSSCGTKYQVYNIKEVTLGQYDWQTTHDHSKWAVSADKNKKWTCLGDINRQASQSKRGGGTMCIVDPDLWSAFNGMVADYEHCDSKEAIKPFSGTIDIL